MSKITVNGITFEPSGPGPAGAGMLSADASQSDYLLVQTTTPLGAAERAALEKLKVEVLEYVPESTYICRYAGTDLSKLRALPFVAWANVYMQGFKVASALLRESPAADAGMMPAAAAPTPLSARPRTVTVVLHKGKNAKTAKKAVAEAARVDPDSIQVGTGKLVLTVAADRLDEIAAIDEVRHVEEMKPKRLFNDVARKILKASPTVGGSTFEGSGEVVAVCDTGLDKGSTTNVHAAFTGRVKALYALGRPGNANDPHGHGTHVAGSVLGAGQSTSMGGAIRGTAPEAKLVLQSVLDGGGGLGGIPIDLRDLLDAPYSDHGARVHTNSWGDQDGDGSYSQQCHDLDDYVWRHRDLVVCFAAGNDGKDEDGNGRVDVGSVGAPGTAKNCITVGATESVRPHVPTKYSRLGFTAAPITDDLIADNAEGMAAFSSRGPTRADRIKPDLVAPGTSILSTRSRDLSSVPTIWGVSLDNSFFFDSGTSMATPLVAGCAAALRQYLRSIAVAKPSAALVKALLVNGAREIQGQYVPTEAGSIPSFDQGFGRVDLENSLPGAAPGTVIQFLDEDAASRLSTGDSRTVQVLVPLGTRALKATLVWTDLAGEALQNDLDLVVRSNGSERHGNMPANSAQFDRVNNVEQVLWRDVGQGPAEVVVRAHRTLEPQTYALVIRLA